jgi:hypothetical protein
MKFIITESKLEKVLFKYLDSVFEILEYYGDYWVVYKDTDQVIATVLDGNYKISTHGFKEINKMFSMESPESDLFFLEWVESKIGFETSGYSQTPYIQRFPSYFNVKKDNFVKL